MANPQKENGYAPIANEILEHLAQVDLSGSEFRCVNVLIRKTYGFNKKEDYISLTQWEKFTKLSRPTVIKATRNLLCKKVFIKNLEKYKLNKNWEEWGSKSVFTSKGVFTSTSKSVFTNASKSVFTYKRHLLNTFIKDKSVVKLLENNILEIMYSYSDIDEDGNPIKRKIKKITKVENTELIRVGLLWRKMVCEHLRVLPEEVVMKNIYYPIKALYSRDHFKLEEFKKLFEYFFNDPKIKDEDKMGFDLAMSEKYVAKYKLSKRIREVPKTLSQISDEIKL